MTRPALVVDDDDDNRRILGVLLPRIGLQPLVAADGEEALRIALGQRLVLVITELYLPTGPARCFAQVLKRHPDLAPVPVLVYSAHCTESDMRWAADCGCEGFVAKPATWSELEPAINRLLADRPLS